MSDNVQQIKERLNVVDVISGYLKLNKAGVNYKALCPFHNEKTPSFMVSLPRQSWHCFGCGEGGDIFTFIQKIEGVEFPEALKILAEKAGVVLERVDPKLKTEKDRVLEICEKAAQFFTESFSHGPRNGELLSYLKKRGLNETVISDWRLGYAPDSWDSLLNFLRSRGYKDSEIEKTGLVIQTPHLRQDFGGQARYHDRFRNRLMFPIFDTSGRVIAFSGRIMSDVIPSKTEKPDAGKYINSPETILYNKSRILYGLDRARTDIRKSDKAILVEGQMDVLLPWQDGVKNIVATSGTALTEEQLSILKRLTSNLVLAFDTDDAGFKATKRGIDLAQTMGFDVSVLNLESGKDPADFVKEKPGEFFNTVNNAEPIMSYYFRQAFKRFSPERIEGKKFIAVTLLSEIKRLPSAIEKSNWLRDLALRLGVSERDLEEEMDRLDVPVPILSSVEASLVSSCQKAGSTSARGRKEILSDRLLALLLKRPELVSEAAKITTFLPGRDCEILSAFVPQSGTSADKSARDFSEIRSALVSDLRPRLDFLCLAADYEMEKFGADFDVGSEIKFLIKEVEREYYKEKLNRIGLAIQNQENLSAVQTEDDGGKGLEALTKEFQSISKKIHQINDKEIKS